MRDTPLVRPAYRSEAPRRTADSGRRPTAELLASVGGHVVRLVQQEAALARAEIVEKAGQAGIALGLVAAAGLIGFVGLLYLLASATLALSKALEGWLAALAVGIIVVILGAGLAWMALSRLKASSLKPSRTVRSIKDDVAWAKERIQ